MSLVARNLLVQMESGGIRLQAVSENRWVVEDLDFQRPTMQSSVLTFTSFEPMGSWTLGGRMMNPMLRGASSENASTGTMSISVATQRNGARAMCV